MGKKFKKGDMVITLRWDDAQYYEPTEILEVTTEWEYPIITKNGRFREDNTKHYEPSKKDNK